MPSSPDRERLMDEATDLDLITDHLFQPGRPPQERDECGRIVDGWPCGFGAAEHEQGRERLWAT